MHNTGFRGNNRNDMGDLALSETFVPDVPKDIIFPDELNAYLRDQIQYLTHENGMFKKHLTEAEAKLKEDQIQLQILTKQLKQYEDAAPTNNFSSVSNIASTKIVELSRKLREKSSELESVKTKCMKLEHQLFLLQQKEETEGPVEKEVPPAKDTTEQEEEIRQLQEKLSSISSKFFDTKNINAQLKNDLKMANKFLQQEVGDNFETVQALAGTGNWRGRAQIICDLQQKNVELREKLRQLQERKPDCKVTEPVSNSKYDRRVEILSKENMILKADIQELKKKVDGSRARSKASDSENSILKAKLTMLLEQQENDRDLIATMTGQLSTIKNLQNDDMKYKEQLISKLQRECKNLYSELSKEKCKHDNMKQELEAKISQLVESQRYKNFSRPSSSTKTVNEEKTINRLEAERMRLLELTEMTNKRLEVERNNLIDVQLQYKTERQRNAKLEAKIARLELDSSGRQSTYSLTTARSSKKEDDSSAEDKLELAEENVKALKTRLEMSLKERELDFQEFSQILKNYAPNDSKQKL